MPQYKGALPMARTAVALESAAGDESRAHGGGGGGGGKGGGGSRTAEAQAVLNNNKTERRMMEAIHQVDRLLNGGNGVKRRTSEDLVLDKSFKHSGGFNRQEQLKRRHSEPDVLSTVLAERISQKESLQQGGSGQNMQASSVHNGSCAAASAGTSADAPPVFRDSFARSKAAKEELAASGALEA